MKTPMRMLLLLIIGALLIFNGSSLRKSSDADKSAELIDETLPPSMQVASIALGPMKGLLADILWWRSERLQDNHEFFEAMQLAEWMTSLQPTYPSVWGYQGFNLAFNISHNFSSVDDRWKWIHAGIKLLRDRGMSYIPDWNNNKELRYELMNIFARKMQGLSDPEARRLRDLWTLETLAYFPTGSRQEIELLAAAPRNAELLMKDEGIRKLVEGLKKTDKEFIKMIQENPPTLKDLKADIPQNKTFNNAIILAMRYAQRYRIKRDLNLDMDRVIIADDRFGPLDWRTHEAQIMYWGLEDEFEEYSLKGVNYAHFVREAMISSFFNGRVVMSENKDYFMRSQNLAILAKVHDYFDYILFDALKPNTSEWHKVNNLHKSFIEKAIIITYTYNQKKASKELFDIFQNDYMKDKKVSFEQFMIRGFTKSLQGGTKTAKKGFVESIVFDAFRNAFTGEWDRYHGLIKKAKLIHRAYQLKHDGVTARQLPPFLEIVKSAKSQYEARTGKALSNLNEIEKKAEAYKNPKEISIGGQH